MTRRCSRWLLLALLPAALVSAAPELKPTSPEDMPALPDPTGEPLLLVRPYLQNLGQDRAGLWFETTNDQAASVTLYPPAGDKLEATDGPSRIHGFTATGLEPATEYRYDVRLNKQIVYQGSFTTWPASLEAIRFFAYGDTRTRTGMHKAVADAMAARADQHLFVLHSGDLVVDGRKHEYWPAQFFGPAENLLAKVPLMPAMGNHEQKTSLFRNYFDLPGEEYYYGFTVGPVHVTVIDLYRDLLDEGDWRETPEGKWLLADLEKAEEVPWRIAIFHTPIYSRAGHGKLDENGQPKEAAMRFARNTLLPLFQQHGYRLTIHGHDHNYERSTIGDLVTVTSGGGGAPTYQAGPEAQNPYSQVFYSGTHYMDLTADANSLSFKVYSVDGAKVEQIDEVTMQRK